MHSGCVCQDAGGGGRVCAEATLLKRDEEHGRLLGGNAWVCVKAETVRWCKKSVQ